MARVSMDGDVLQVALSLADAILAFHGSFHIPLAHVVRASTATREELELTFRVLGTDAGRLKTAGIFTTPQGIIFCDISGRGDCLLLETRGETFPRLAFTLDADQDPAALARAINEHVASAPPSLQQGEGGQSRL